MSDPPALPALPPPLRQGDRVQLVAASSALQTSERLDAGIQVLRRWGLEVADPAPLVGRRWGYLAGRDSERAQDLAQPDPAGPAAPLLACVRGGWGSARLLELPDGQPGLPCWQHQLPGQWLLGFSDVTSLLWAQWAKGSSGGVHGPLITTLASEPSWSQERLHNLLFGKGVPPLTGSGWVGGVVDGPLLVANLTVATHLLGTPYLPDLRGAIVVFEDVGEAPYRIERMLTHWRLCGALQQLAGIGWGSFTACIDGDRADQAPDTLFSTEQVLRERTADLGIPVVANLPVGHGPGNAALPIGVPARLDGDRGLLELHATWATASGGRASGGRAPGG